MSKKIISQTYHINASIEAAWDLLTNIKKYPEWNPFVIKCESSSPPTQQETMLHMTVRWEDGRETKTKEEVIEAEAPSADASGNKSALWIYSYRSWISSLGMVKSVRTQGLSQVSGEPVKYISEISLTGWGVRMTPLKKIEKGMQMQAEGLIAELKKRNT